MIPKPPTAKRMPHAMTTHGITRVDDYYWMNQRDSKDVLDYLNDENAYAKAILKPTEVLQDKLFKEIKSRIKEDDQSVPFFRKKYWYYTRFEKGKEYPIYCRKYERMDNPEEIILNVNLLAEGHTYCNVGEMMITDDNKILAFAVDYVSRRIYDIYFKNLETGEIYSDKIEKTTGNFTWTADNRTLFYAKQNRQLRAYKVFKHRFDTLDKDVEIFYEKNAKFDVGVGRTKSEDFVFIYSGSTLSSEFRYIPADKPDSEFKIFQKRTKNLEYSIEHEKNHFYILTNWKAKNFKLMETPVNSTEKTYWKDLIPHREDVKLEDFDVFTDFLVLEERENALNRIRIINKHTKEDYFLPCDEEVYNTGIGYNPEFDTNLLNFGYTSLTTPNTQYEFNMQTKQQKLLKRQSVLDANFKSENYEAKRLWAKAKDGTKVPISLVYKKSLFSKTKNPALLYGYGSYGYSIDPFFSSARLSLLDRGFVYAIAHIRGGEEMGRHWYEDGKFLKKANTFTDFIACAEELIKDGYSDPKKLSAMGGSAGGLLIGAVANERPDLFKAMVAEVPFVDVVTTMLDESIPLTVGEYEEWGNPNDKAYFDYMHSYSPYDNVKKQDYPHLLVTAGYHDSQVQYWEPAKWVAKLRATKTDKNMLLLVTEMDFGHSGASGRFESLKETAMEYAFLMYALGVKGD